MVKQVWLKSTHEKKINLFRLPDYQLQGPVGSRGWLLYIESSCGPVEIGYWSNTEEVSSLTSGSEATVAWSQMHVEHCQVQQVEVPPQSQNAPLTSPSR